MRSRSLEACESTFAYSKRIMHRKRWTMALWVLVGVLVLNVLVAIFYARSQPQDSYPLTHALGILRGHH